MTMQRMARRARPIAAAAVALAALAVPTAAAHADDDVPYCGTTGPIRFTWPGGGVPVPGDPVICPQCGPRLKLNIDRIRFAVNPASLGQLGEVGQVGQLAVWGR
ncbi:MAG: hypothetical protein IPI32_08300 [Austwickia sp.]|nr:hypothetical protein [Austwickia sp.]MBK9102195.1 hypothetical protein [Austwickia sp.]